MGQKVHPLGLRLGLTENWRSRWFTRKNYAKLLEEDLKIRQHIVSKLSRAGISRIETERAGDQLTVDIYTARPGIVIGKKGTEVNVLRTGIEEMTGRTVQINIQEVKRPEIDASLIAQSVAGQLEARVSFRRAMKKAVTAAMTGRAQGIKIACAGRLGGAEMARKEWYREGRVPLHTLRANIDYGFAEALTISGRIGVKVWVYKGDVLPFKEEEIREKGKEKPAAEAASSIESLLREEYKPLVGGETEKKAVKEAEVVQEKEAKEKEKPKAKKVAKKETKETAKKTAKKAAKKTETEEKETRATPKRKKTKKAAKASFEKTKAKGKKAEAEAKGATKKSSKKSKEAK